MNYRKAIKLAVKMAILDDIKNSKPKSEFDSMDLFEREAMLSKLEVRDLDYDVLKNMDEDERNEILIKNGLSPSEIIF